MSFTSSQFCVDNVGNDGQAVCKEYLYLQPLRYLTWMPSTETILHIHAFSISRCICVAACLFHIYIFWIDLINASIYSLI